MVVDGDEKTTPLDYQLYGASGTQLKFRGPPPDFEKPFHAVLGGADVFGRYVEAPFPAIMSEWGDTPAMNMGVCQAGLSLYTAERFLLDMACQAKVTVLQVLGAQNMSNRLYSVHSRRNDRFLGVSPELRKMFPNVDFTEVNFTGHLLETLSDQSSAAFDVLIDELKWSWVQRMRRILSFIDGDVFLLWICDRRPEDSDRERSGRDPLFVDRDMLNSLSDQISGVIEVIEPEETSLIGKIYAPSEIDAARVSLSPSGHARVAEAVMDAIGGVSGGAGRANASARAS